MERGPAGLPAQFALCISHYSIMGRPAGHREINLYSSFVSVSVVTEMPKVNNVADLVFYAHTAYFEILPRPIRHCDVCLHFYVNLDVISPVHGSEAGQEPVAKLSVHWRDISASFY